MLKCLNMLAMGRAKVGLYFLTTEGDIQVVHALVSKLARHSE